MLEKNELPMGSLIGDPIPGAPELAARGEHPAGVRTVRLFHPGQADVLAGLRDGHYPRRDRPLDVEIWYPAALSGGEERAVYSEYMGRADWNDLEPFTFDGRAWRDAAPDAAGGPWPVVVVSHGYPGSRMLLSNLSENLAGKGYVVMNIGHTDNTYADFPLEGSLESALIHRSRDQRFLIDRLPAMNAEGWLKGMLDCGRVGLMGFSMGGYGLLRTLGAPAAADLPARLPLPEDELEDENDGRGVKAVKAAVLFAPASFLCGGAGIECIDQPTLWVCGSADRIVGYDAVRDYCARAVRSDRWFLTFENCGHNVANNPAPEQAMARPWKIAKRWADPVWDTRRLNNVNCHFVTAFMDLHLKGREESRRWLEVPVERGIDAVWKTDENGSPLEGHTYWPGFAEGTAAGLRLEHFGPGRT